MRPEIKRAIARITSIRDDRNTVLGTGFLVTERHLLTAFHVVGDRIQSSLSDAPFFYSALRVTFPDAGLCDLAAKVTEGCFDVIGDWALLELDNPTAGIFPLTLGELSPNSNDDSASRAFESWGFPAIAEMAGGALFIDGRVQGALSQGPEIDVYQLYSDNVAAGQSARLDGFSGAPCLVDGVAVGIIRSNLVSPLNRDSVAAGVLFACPINNDVLQTRCARYLPAIDPILGLPGLPHQALPAEPFRYLRWYGAEHAEVFFGRSRRLRELYEQVVDNEGPGVILVYGASGVGKSSLLEAGLLPRLRWSYEARAHRREAGKTLLELFEDRLKEALAATDTSNKPVVLVIDQIEEAFTSRSFGNAELSQLAHRLKRLKHERRDTRILIGFRSEWLAEVRARLREAEVVFTEFFLERLTQDEIEEVVRGIVSTRRLRSWYNVGVDDDLPARIGMDLLSDPKSPITPMLSIILTRLWQEAKKDRAGNQCLSLTHYDVRMRGKLDLDQFLEEQINVLAEIYPQHVNSGLVEDILYRHTTDYGTALELSRSETFKLYAHLADQKHDIEGLIDELLRNALLYTVATADDERSTRLAHDTLASPVRRRFDRSERLGQRAIRRLSDRAKEWDPRDPSAGLLDVASLELVRKGLVGSRAPTGKEVTYLNASKEADESSRRQSRRIRLASAVAFCIAVITAVIWWQHRWLHLMAYQLTQVHTAAVGSLSVGSTFKECSHCPEMVVLPTGRIIIGSPTAAVKEMAREQPAKMLEFETPIAVSKHEITNDEWDQCVRFSFCSQRADPATNGNTPITNVSWADARDYASWLKQVTAEDYRLLSEAEWEYAARGGKSTYFSFGNDDKELDLYAWYGGGLALTEPQEVGKKRPNDFGLFDMHGNVSEWVADCFRDNYGDGPKKEPWNETACIRHVIRGGSYLDKPRGLRSSARDWSSSGSSTIGIRVGRSIRPSDSR
ncbi:MULTISPECIES: SUMF1/EgtB/PvdO family nonheme iron enzyme [unclassified Bradyrhizobium]|uniref:SUMF1/EgtB/PvdO family nonheme iron enzyme n=1 Tax=unclassified Bradyrhizobium TaxID=2631580 RepID=UPI0032EA5F61